MSQNCGAGRMYWESTSIWKWIAGLCIGCSLHFLPVDFSTASRFNRDKHDFLRNFWPHPKHEDKPWLRQIPLCLFVRPKVHSLSFLFILFLQSLWSSLICSGNKNRCSSLVPPHCADPTGCDSANPYATTAFCRSSPCHRASSVTISQTIPPTPRAPLPGLVLQDYTACSMSISCWTKLTSTLGIWNQYLML